MLRYDRHPSRQRDAVAQREVVLDAVVDYRFLAPAKIAADELRERERARAALSAMLSRSAGTSWRWRAPLRRRLGAALVAAGTRMQGNLIANFDPHPELAAAEAEAITTEAAARRRAEARMERATPPPSEP